MGKTNKAQLAELHRLVVAITQLHNWQGQLLAQAMGLVGGVDGNRDLLARPSATGPTPGRRRRAKTRRGKPREQ